MARGDLQDEEWALIGALLPAERGRWARPAMDNRRFLNGMLYVLRVGCPWRDMHERYGKWNSVYVRFRRWAGQGVWDALLETLVEMGLTDDWQHMIDSTTVRGHSQAAGAKGEKAVDQLIELPVANPKLMLADKGYDSDDVRSSLLIKGIVSVIPTKVTRKEPIACDFRAYIDRNRVERMFNKLKQFRRIATR